MRDTITACLLFAYAFGLIERTDAWFMQRRNGSFKQLMLALVLGTATLFVGILE